VVDLERPAARAGAAGAGTASLPALRADVASWPARPGAASWPAREEEDVFFCFVLAPDMFS